MTQELRSIRYIGTPYGMGMRGYLSGSGPLSILQDPDFLIDAKILLGEEPRIDWVEADEPHGLSFNLPRGDQNARTMQQIYDLRELVASAVERHDFPILFSGTCSTSLAVVAGLNDPDVGVLWFDAHADTSTPETSSSGFFGGMPLAIVNGQCFEALRESIPGFHMVPEGRIVSVGMHDLLAGRPGPLGELVDRAAIERSGGLQGALESALDRLRERCKRVYLHIDADILDNRVTAVHQYADSVDGGFSLEELTGAIDLAFDRFEVGAVNFTDFDSMHDERTIPVMRNLAHHTAQRALS